MAQGVDIHKGRRPQDLHMAVAQDRKPEAVPPADSLMPPGLRCGTAWACAAGPRPSKSPEEQPATTRSTPQPGACHPASRIRTPGAPSRWGPWPYPPRRNEIMEALHLSPAAFHGFALLGGNGQRHVLIVRNVAVGAGAGHLNRIGARRGAGLREAAGAAGRELRGRAREAEPEPPSSTSRAAF